MLCGPPVQRWAVKSRKQVLSREKTTVIIMLPKPFHGTIIFAMAVSACIATSASAAERSNNEGKAKNDNPIHTTLIATAGVALGAVATALASAYSAGQKVREIEVSYKLKLSEAYLSNARQYTGSVYMPIAIALSSLNDSYRRFRSSLDEGTRLVQPDIVNAFRASCHAYLSELSHLYTRGADAFLTTSMEERLGSFNSFLETSLRTKNVISKIIIAYDFTNPFFNLPRLSTTYQFEAQARSAKMLRIIDAGLQVSNGVTGYRREVLGAPVNSIEFEQRIAGEMPILKYLIKEVTLGSQSSG